MATEVSKAQIPLDIQVIKGHGIKIYVENPDVKTADEFMAIFADWPEQFGYEHNPSSLVQFIDLKYAGGPTSPPREHYYLSIFPKTRRHFAALPAILRKAQKLSYKVYYQRDDEYVPCYRSESMIDLDENPAVFWQAIALAQMWYEKS